MSWLFDQKGDRSKSKPVSKPKAGIFEMASATCRSIHSLFILKGVSRSFTLSKTARFFQITSELMKGSIPLPSCLESIERSELDRSLKATAREIKENLLAGGSFSDSFKKSRTRWQRAVYILVNTGEKNGLFLSSLDRAREILRLQIKWQEQLRAQLAYPALLLVSSSLIFALYFFFIGPLFAEIQTDSQDLMKPSSDLSAWPLKRWLFSVPFLVGLFLLAKVRESAKAVVEQLAFWRRYRRERDLSLLFDLLAQLLKEQTAFDQTWRLMPRCTVDVHLNAELMLLVEHMLFGQLPSQAFAQLKGIGELELQFLRIGERTGQMAAALQRLSTLLQERCQKRLKTFLAILQPALLVVLGLIISRIALLVMRPLREMQIIDFS